VTVRNAASNEEDDCPERFRLSFIDGGGGVWKRVRIAFLRGSLVGMLGTMGYYARIRMRTVFRGPKVGCVENVGVCRFPILSGKIKTDRQRIHKYIHTSAKPLKLRPKLTLTHLFINYVLRPGTII